jgi:hypothetical protein
MSEKRDEATLRIYVALEAYERAIDIAAARGAELAAEMPLARLDAVLPARAGQEAYRHVIASLGELAGVRGQIIESHRELARVSKALHLPVVAFGDCDDIPAAKAQLREVPTLRHSA